MKSWSMADKYGDEILIQPSGDPDRLDICIIENDESATVLLTKEEAIVLRDALTIFIEAMP